MENMNCVCGKRRVNINDTNWSRHLSSCKKMKLSKSAPSVSSFFKTYTKTDHINSTGVKSSILFDEVSTYNENIIDKSSENDIVQDHKMKSSVNIESEKPSILIDEASSFSENSISKFTEKNMIPDVDDNVLINMHTECNVDNMNFGIDNNKNMNNDVVKNIENLDISNDPGKFPNHISNAMLTKLIELGPCQPKPWELPLKMFPKTQDSEKNFRSFHENHYNRIIKNNLPVRRIWLAYSISLDKVYCISCKLFGFPNAKKFSLAENGTRDWKNLKRNLENHESTPEHMQSEISRGLFTKNLRIDLQLHSSSNRQIAENREVVRSVIEVLLFIARQNIAIRGHDEKISSQNRGNFLELLKLLAHNNPSLMVHFDKINSKERNRLTFVSHDTQNLILSILGEQVRNFILNDLKDAGMFSIIIDTTTDVSNVEQFSLVVRYVHQGKINERLLSLEVASDATGRGLYELFRAIMEKYSINWKRNLIAQAYDGAASMQGEYSGLRTHVQSENPKAIYIWCFAHLLNLVIVDTLDSSIDTKVFFGNLQELVTFMRARKRAAVFKECQQKLNLGSEANKRIRKIKRFSETRWTSHDRVVTVIHDQFNALKKTLKILSNSTDRVTAAGATNFLTIISSFNFIIILKFVKYIFTRTTPASCYLQSINIDFIQAISLIDTTKNELIKLRSDDKFNELLEDAKQFAIEHKLPEKSLKEIRVRKVPKFADENVNDEISCSVFDRFKINTYYKGLDSIISSINNRFSGARDILKDISLLSSERLMSFENKTINDLPSDSFVNVSLWLEEIEIDKLRNEYIMISQSLKKLISNMELPKKLHDNTDSKSKFNEIEDETFRSTESESDSDDGDTGIKQNINAINILNMLTHFNLESAFPNIALAYKALGTIPSSSSSAERSFSKMKLIKSRLRSTMSQTRLESLMLLSMERDIQLNIDEAIDTLGNTSKVLIQYFTPSLPLCILSPWLRELGFVIFYGAIDLKLYRILMQFRTRKAHCWTVNDKDLLKYLLFGVIVVTVYLAAWTAASLNFFNEGWVLLINFTTEDGIPYTACKPQWWNHVTEFGELMILTVGLYYGNSARNARVQFEERRFLFYAITAELTFSTIFNAFRTIYPIPFHQDVTFVAAFLRSLLTNTLALFIIFAPKVWYQKKVNAELRHSAMNQELSESLKADLVDKDLREMNISEMTADEIREELSRVYVQMGILRDKTVCKKNPHISKRKGGKKLPHRRFSLQKKGSKDKSSIKIRKKNRELDSSEISEANEMNEVSKSPEDSVVSNEDVLAGGSGHGNCNCHSTTGIHQQICNENNDFTTKYS